MRSTERGPHIQYTVPSAEPQRRTVPTAQRGRAKQHW
jgi:hypothetical protein